MPWSWVELDGGSWHVLLDTHQGDTISEWNGMSYTSNALMSLMDAIGCVQKYLISDELSTLRCTLHLVL